MSGPYSWRLFISEQGAWTEYSYSPYIYNSIEEAKTVAIENMDTAWHAEHKALQWTVQDFAGVRVASGMTNDDNPPPDSPAGGTTPPVVPPKGMDLSWLLYIGLGVAVVAVLYWAYRRMS